jgi:hypothetical protein
MSMNFDEDIECLTCGSDEFKVTRTVPTQIVLERMRARAQIVLECLKCERPHILEGGIIGGQPVLLYWDPSKRLDKARARHAVKNTIQKIIEVET